MRQFVYVIGLRAVQFGNNWMNKILRTAKIGRGRRPSPIWLSEEFFESNYYFQNWTACSPIIYTNCIYNKILDRDWFSARLFVT